MVAGTLVGVAVGVAVGVLVEVGVAVALYGLTREISHRQFLRLGYAL